MEPDFIFYIKIVSPESYPLNFFILACVIYGIGSKKSDIFSWNHRLHFDYHSRAKIPSKVRQLPKIVQNLCSMTNISVLIYNFFNEDLKGYYIHGKKKSMGNPMVSRDPKSSGYADIKIQNETSRGYINLKNQFGTQNLEALSQVDGYSDVNKF